MLNFLSLKYYDELSPEAQRCARVNVMIPDEAAHAANIAEAKYFLTLAKLNRLKSKMGLSAQGATIHTFINDPLHIRRIVNGARALYQARKHKDSYIAAYALSNRCIFTDCGSYVYYVKHFTVITDGREYIPTQEEQAALRDPYIEINQRYRK